MTQEYSVVDLSNNIKLPKTIKSNATNENNVNVLLQQENGKQIWKMSGKHVIQKLCLFEHSLIQSSNIFVVHLLELVDLNLCNSDLTDLPYSFNILKKLMYLNIDNNRFCTLPKVICELQNMRKLWACGNRMKQVPNELGNLLNLEVLSLSMNRLTDLPPSCAKLNQLEVCCLSDNRFKKIPECINKGMKGLLILVFSRNPHIDLNVYPKSINLTSFYGEGNESCPSFPIWILSSKYKKLETVALNDTRFNTFTFWKNKSTSYVKRLLMKQSSVKDIHVERIVDRMTSLEELVIGNSKGRHRNYFSSMPIETMQQPASLKHIDMHATGLPVVPETINKFVNLYNMNLSFNTIYFLPEEICSLKNLSSLIMGSNGLTCLPDNFGNLVSLRELDLRHNSLNRLPDSMKSLSNLQYMDLYDNEFETIPEVIDNLPQLIGLDLEQNYFSTEYLWHNRASHYVNMRETLRKYWLDPPFGYKSHCGPKVKPAANDESLSSSSLSSSSSSTSISSSTKNYSSMEGAFHALPWETCNQLINERWDTTDDSADEFDPHECKEPKKRMFSPFTYFKPFQKIYCPGESHPQRVITRVIKMLQNGTLVWPTRYEEGQFEDP